MKLCFEGQEEHFGSGRTQGGTTCTSLDKTTHPLRNEKLEKGDTQESLDGRKPPNLHKNFPKYRAKSILHTGDMLKLCGKTSIKG